MKSSRAMRNPDAAEVAAFATICALLLFVPATPLVEHFASFASERGLSAPQAGSLLVACVFAALASVAMLVSLTFATLRRRR